jgi:hypothetical protein
MFALSLARDNDNRSALSVFYYDPSSPTRRESSRSEQRDSLDGDCGVKWRTVVMKISASSLCTFLQIDQAIMNVVKSALFWAVPPCSSARIHRYFEGSIGHVYRFEA